LISAARAFVRDRNLLFDCPGVQIGLTMTACIAIVLATSASARAVYALPMILPMALVASRPLRGKDEFSNNVLYVMGIAFACAVALGAGQRAGTGGRSGRLLGETAVIAALSLAVTVPALSASAVHAAAPVRYATVTVRPGDNIWSLAEARTANGGDVQAVVDQLNAGKITDPRAAVQQIDAILTPDEAASILLIGAKMRSDMRALVTPSVAAPSSPPPSERRDEGATRRAPDAGQVLLNVMLTRDQLNAQMRAMRGNAPAPRPSP